MYQKKKEIWTPPSASTAFDHHSQLPSSAMSASGKIHDIGLLMGACLLDCGLQHKRSPHITPP
jgi:hypothetical protein